MLMQHNLVWQWFFGPLVGAGAAVVCSSILWFLLGSGIAWRLATDIPNDRSLHTRPTPRIGGWGIVPVVAIAIALFAPSLWLIALTMLFVAAVSQVDDRRGLPARVRFAAHLVVVIAVVIVYPVQVPIWLLAVIAFLMVWLTNLYNFMDGADGLAGGMTLLGFAGYAVGALISARPSPELALAAAAVAGAAAGFLVFNFHPARIFLGDAGSIPIGFLAGALGYWGWRGDVWPIWFPVLIFSPFIGDASVTLLRRMLRGEKIWQAHREHYYQRMVQYGLGHSKTACVWYVVMLGGIILADMALSWSSMLQWCSVSIWMGVLAVIGVGVDSRWRRFNSATFE
ncbi:putative undecaprenyl-phosphate N-acetylglucosaminyl 1-phosphate transferase [Paraburkholderia nemoris]|uniref:MraY family glycosyltransferase n=1 Tax=Paraburkholderia nemoris TaxID=2793076 RepID=UPI001911D2F7|nr:glycosyltransferase family 4 protein [Paraburkholderia nemoris]MBK5151789.1 glycosyltransferase family 4 protein [Burkholderia sp. R-69608]CAE6923417.1 putative undecaprenyl-phosphate N-acetylglucosaminyl 1-phosphate transferase [Paraburkholderia nemoris]